MSHYIAIAHVSVYSLVSYPSSYACYHTAKSQIDLHTLIELDANSNDLRNGCKTPSCSKLDDSPFRSGNPLLQNVCLPRQVSCEEMSTSNVIAPSPPPIIEPPAWAVAAKGDARLEVSKVTCLT